MKFNSVLKEQAHFNIDLGPISMSGQLVPGIASILLRGYRNSCLRYVESSWRCQNAEEYSMVRLHLAIRHSASRGYYALAL